MTFGLIGYGRFGRLAARLLSRRGAVIVYDRRRVPVGRSGRVRRGTLAEAARCPVVILAVPVSAMRSALRAIAPVVLPGTVVTDVCAVKSVTATWMRESLPRSVHLLGTHPFFGPDSAKGGVRGLTMVLCPVRIPAGHVRTVRRLLIAEGVRVQVLTPREHDRLAAKTIALSQFVGNLLDGAGLGRERAVTPHYEKLAHLVTVAGNDDPAVFLDMWRFNPFAREVERSLDRSRRSLERRLRGR
jgi:prephenate dehydrogenase